MILSLRWIESLNIYGNISRGRINSDINTGPSLSIRVGDSSYIPKFSREGGYGLVKESDIKRDLVNQLETNGVHGAHYIDLISDYMSLWHIKNQLILDIKTRGVSVPYQNGPSQSGSKKNDSISELNKTNAQMLRILNELGLRAGDIRPPDDDVGEL